MLKKLVLLGVARGILVAGLAAGCAGGAREPSKQEYVSKLNAMCEDFSAREQEIGEPHTLADRVDKGPRILDAFEKAIADKVGTLTGRDRRSGETLGRSRGPAAGRTRQIG